MTQKALVIGFGSIGQRHARLLQQMGVDTAVLSRRALDYKPAYRELVAALRSHAPDYVILANETRAHFETLNALADTGFSGRVLVEKPLFGHTQAVPEHGFAALNVAYNLRFHPVLNQLKEALSGQKILSAQIYVGQYLPNWRPGTDYRTSYSASRAQGGGVLRDLSHELDYLIWLFGSVQCVSAIAEKLSDLQIDSEDSVLMLARHARCPALTLQLNYLDRIGGRSLLVHTQEHSYKADLVANTLESSAHVAQHHEVGRDSTYLEQHRACLNPVPDERLCSAEQAMAVMRYIDIIEQAGTRRQWIQA